MLTDRSALSATRRRGTDVEKEVGQRQGCAQCRKRPTGDWRTAARREKVQKKNSNSKATQQ